MPVIRVGKRKRRYQMPVIFDQAIRHCRVHGSAPRYDLQRIEVRPVRLEIPDPLIVDVLAPARTENAGARQFDHQIGDGHGIERRGVDEGGEARHDD